MTTLSEHQVEEEKRLSEIENKIECIQQKLDTISLEISDLVTAWKAASWLVSMVKWIAGVAVAFTAIITFVKGK